jgi:hypothetical protein
MPLHTLLIVGGSWVVLLLLTVWFYRRTRDGDGRPSRELPTQRERDE